MGSKAQMMRTPIGLEGSGKPFLAVAALARSSLLQMPKWPFEMSKWPLNFE